MKDENGLRVGSDTFVSDTDLAASRALGQNSPPKFTGAYPMDLPWHVPAQALSSDWSER